MPRPQSKLCFTKSSAANKSSTELFPVDSNIPSYKKRSTRKTTDDESAAKIFNNAKSKPFESNMLLFTGEQNIPELKTSDLQDVQLDQHLEVNPVFHLKKDLQTISLKEMSTPLQHITNIRNRNNVTLLPNDTSNELLGRKKKLLCNESHLDSNQSNNAMQPEFPSTGSVDFRAIILQDHKKTAAIDLLSKTNERNIKEKEEGQEVDGYGKTSNNSKFNSVRKGKLPRLQQGLSRFSNSKDYDNNKQLDETNFPSSPALSPAQLADDEFSDSAESLTSASSQKIYLQENQTVNDPFSLDFLKARMNKIVDTDILEVDLSNTQTTSRSRASRLESQRRRKRPGATAEGINKKIGDLYLALEEGNINFDSMKSGTTKKRPRSMHNDFSIYKVLSPINLSSSDEKSSDEETKGTLASKNIQNENETTDNTNNSIESIYEKQLPVTHVSKSRHVLENPSIRRSLRIREAQMRNSDESSNITKISTTSKSINSNINKNQNPDLGFKKISLNDFDKEGDELYSVDNLPKPKRKKITVKHLTTSKKNHQRKTKSHGQTGPRPNSEKKEENYRQFDSDFEFSSMSQDTRLNDSSIKSYEKSGLCAREQTTINNENRRTTNSALRKSEDRKKTSKPTSKLKNKNKDSVEKQKESERLLQEKTTRIKAQFAEIDKHELKIKFV